jgi:hypothetical protein
MHRGPGPTGGFVLTQVAAHRALWSAQPRSPATATPGSSSRRSVLTAEGAFSLLLLRNCTLEQLAGWAIDEGEPDWRRADANGE